MCLVGAERTLIGSADRVTVVSESLRRYFAERYDATAEFIPNGIPNKQRVPPGTLLTAHDLVPGKYVLFASRLTPEKGCHDLIAAFNTLDATLLAQSGMKLVIAGGTAPENYLAELRAQADPERVCFVGHLGGDELAEVFSNAYAFVLPSYIEGMSMALLEAIAYALPVLASDIPENRAVLGDFGTYCAPRNVADLRRELDRLIRSPNAAFRMSDRMARLCAPGLASSCGTLRPPVPHRYAAPPRYRCRCARQRMTLFTTAPRLLVDRLLQKFGRAAGLVLLARVLQNLNGFLLSILIVRRFGLQGAGTLVIATIAIVVLALIGTCGLPYTLARMNIDPRQRNTVGLFACMAVVPLSLPFVGALGLIVGHSHKEALVIALLALGGPFFAQTNITNALQVLLNKPGDAIIPPIGNLLGLIVAAWVSPGFVTFAAILAAFRFAAIGCAFLRLPCRRTSFRMLITHMADGARYLIADAINLGTDQAAMLILSFILSRAQLGLLGLCRQLITVSDTPGWSQIQAFYPGMVADPARNGPLLISRLRWIGIVSAASVALLTAPLGLWIYRAPGFLVLAPLLQVSTPI